MTFDFDAVRIRQLLDELDQRLRSAGIAATVYVVGGAAISLHLPNSDRPTQDIDGITTESRVAEIVAHMAHELGLPEGWLNGAARPFLPPLPADALAPPEHPGLRVQLASLEQLLAMKLAAGRARDRADIVALAAALEVDAEEAIQLTLDAYGVGGLEPLTTLEDVVSDAHALIPGRQQPG
ncbi:DUF6036 family nucleotidyltransferase [Knoellia subterranea]|uniref:Nucleotidyl transferase n=1 Tax=Knoellia subterranea KCTC 19937 TaxID=1385521 RepID=A0A0A0JR79_9MICO|nr:DUF6036 family nucleotidyltransferase [Knoellia subterranea]KGN38076.1 nucleotidyl transferase [Knoellia subterranea KCTC 19937]